MTALAASLDNDPRKIHQWVHDNIQFIPSYGAIQGSRMTLENRRGNAFDTASLLIALLRAVGIHSRYVYGTVQIPIEQAMNWVGGVTSPEAATDLLSQGGIPTTAITQGGKIIAVKLEHIWAEAWTVFGFALAVGGLMAVAGLIAATTAAGWISVLFATYWASMAMILPKNQTTV